MNLYTYKRKFHLGIDLKIKRYRFYEAGRFLITYIHPDEPASVYNHGLRLIDVLDQGVALPYEFAEHDFTIYPILRATQATAR